MPDRHVRTESEDDARDTARDRRYQAGGTGMAGPTGATERTQGTAARPATPRRLRDDMQALCTGAANMGKHLATLEQKLRRVSERQDQLVLRDPAQQTYGHANHHTQHDANNDELVAHCGLARGEAELLLRLHRN